MFYIYSNKTIEVINYLNSIGVCVLNSRSIGWTGEQLLTSATLEQMEETAQKFGGYIVNNAVHI